MVRTSGAFIQARPSAIEPKKGARTRSRARALVMVAGSCVMAPSREGALHAAQDGIGLVGDALAEPGGVAKPLGVVSGQMALDVGAQLGDARIVHQVQRWCQPDDRAHVLDQAVTEW